MPHWNVFDQQSSGDLVMYGLLITLVGAGVAGLVGAWQTLRLIGTVPATLNAISGVLLLGAGAGFGWLSFG